MKATMPDFYDFHRAQNSQGVTESQKIKITGILDVLELHPLVPQVYHIAILINELDSYST